MSDTTIELPNDFVEAFISYANARQLADTNFDPAIIEAPLDLTAGRHRISLSNSYPGCSPFPQIGAHGQGHRAELGAYYSSVLNTETQTRRQPRTEIHARRDIDLRYPLAAAIAAYDLWVAHS